MTIDLARTIKYLRPNDQWVLVGNDYSGLTWVSDTPKPTEEELNQAWSILEPEVVWDAVRGQRNSLLCGSDWTQFNDVTIPNKEEWATYREKLRTVTTDFPTPQDVIWPVPPT